MFETPTLKKLDDDALPAFVAGRGLGLVLFGSHNGKPTLAQSHVFAELWADRLNDMRFGYVDALCSEASKKHYAVRMLPTILVVRDGCVVGKLEGFHARDRLEAALEVRVEQVARAA
ncbi:MAG: thioredoxin family protein [Vitreimonas sp.]